MEDGVKKARSFRDEGYVNRRVFLRSYPLQWGEEEEGEAAVASSKLVSLKGRLTAAFRWGGEKVLLLKRLKKKVGFYTVACHPFGFKSSSNKLLTV